MAKAPRAGKVKTRLVPPLTAEEARTMSGSFLADITANLALARTEAPICPVIAYAPADTAHLFDGLLAPDTALVLADGETGDMPPGGHRLWPQPAARRPRRCSRRDLAPSAC